jgi:hypothetical protein
MMRGIRGRKCDHGTREFKQWKDIAGRTDKWEDELLVGM